MTLTVWALIAAGAVTLLLCLYFLAERLGREEAAREQLETIRKDRTDADKEMDRIRQLDDLELNRRLRDL